MPFDIFSDIMSSALRSEIITALAAARCDLEIGVDVWDGQSKIAYENVKASADRELDSISSMIGGL